MLHVPTVVPDVPPEILQKTTIQIYWNYDVLVNYSQIDLV